MFKVTNNAPGGRGFNVADGRTVYLEPGETRDLDLAPVGAIEKAWIKAREVEIVEIVETDEQNADDGSGSGSADGQTASGASRAPDPPKLKGGTK